MFSEKQLREIKYAAARTDFPYFPNLSEEMSVYARLRQTDLYDAAFTEMQWNIVKFCAEECERQHSGEMSVYDMVNAWSMVQERIVEDWNPDFQLTVSFIEYIGQIVEPIDNAKGFRTIPIGVTDGFGGWIEKAQYADIPRKLEFLLEVYYEGYLGPQVLEDGVTQLPMRNMVACDTAEDEFYFEFEEIHPFRDGNGRTGKILYNYLKGTLDNPQVPPNFWGGSNP